MSSLQGVRGMPDIIYPDSQDWQSLEEVLYAQVKAFQYKKIILPLVEKAGLFLRGIGEITDIVGKEMYVFSDRNGEDLALRPEGTAGCVRAALENGMIQRQKQKLWYMGPMFRHERPQKGRTRQFFQFGMEAFGFQGVGIEAELLLFTHLLWSRLGLSDLLCLEINSLGSTETRQRYRAALVAFYEAHKTLLDSESLQRLQLNPLRLLDSKSPVLCELNQQAPTLLSILPPDERKKFDDLLFILEKLKIPYTVNPCLVRGLDYYNDMVFEWTSTHLGAQGTVCAGGRYDSLVSTLGGPAIPAVGFAMGIERLLSLCQSVDAFGSENASVDVFIVTTAADYHAFALTCMQHLLQAIPTLHIYYQPEAASFKALMKKADKSGARFVCILTESDVQAGTVTLKALRGSETWQKTLSIPAVISYLRE